MHQAIRDREMGSAGAVVRLLGLSVGRGDGLADITGSITNSSAGGTHC